MLRCYKEVKMLEKSVEQKLCKEVEKRGGKAFKLECPGADGMPDRLVVLPGGKIYFIETKRPKGGRFKKLQKYQISQLQKLGCDARKIKSYEEVEQFIKDVTEEKKNDL